MATNNTATDDLTKDAYVVGAGGIVPSMVARPSSSSPHMNTATTAAGEEEEEEELRLKRPERAESDVPFASAVDEQFETTTTTTTTTTAPDFFFYHQKHTVLLNQRLHFLVRPWPHPAVSLASHMTCHTTLFFEGKMALLKTIYDPVLLTSQEDRQKILAKDRDSMDYKR